MATTFLDDIVSATTEAVTARRRARPLRVLEAEVRTAPAPRPFAAALLSAAPPEREKGFVIIAEIKRTSPSGGVLREECDPREIARTYQSAGAAALSVLTEEKFFGGRLSFLSDLRSIVTMPLLEKDFILDPYQIYEARAAGADCILLIVTLLSREHVSEYLALSTALSLEALVEVHTEEELAVALEAGAELIGINNRDLRTFEVSLATTLRLAPRVPSGKVVVCESGIRTRDEMVQLRDCGVHAFLIGETLMRSPDIYSTLSALTGCAG